MNEVAILHFIILFLASLQGYCPFVSIWGPLESLTIRNGTTWCKGDTYMTFMRWGRELTSKADEVRSLLDL